ncbi:hypothetical protein BDK51DRAFT_46101 [Blyttiomyces helicus]|uniref:Uncharacterized protein n=1 Tax=Blyttiomyces helicus TaxID=388810 RepID=A0A4P9W207_9FUNG|nr:hypothetical protein BDK51DRAFT_46101 [Blyttiomyces helicus]|eukprot:RKO84798.1 hypothetical protein BDK51DRAFT_46101 [Blyttiomyces helicus]
MGRVFPASRSSSTEAAIKSQIMPDLDDDNRLPSISHSAPAGPDTGDYGKATTPAYAMADVSCQTEHPTTIDPDDDQNLKTAHAADERARLSGNLRSLGRPGTEAEDAPKGRHHEGDGCSMKQLIGSGSLRSLEDGAVGMVVRSSCRGLSELQLDSQADGSLLAIGGGGAPPTTNPYLIRKDQAGSNLAVVEGVARLTFAEEGGVEFGKNWPR